MTLPELFESLWTDYTQLNPSALRIYQLLEGRGEDVVNDHIALRTFQHPRLGLQQMAQSFERLGYQAKQDYVFKEKKLLAKHWEHSDPKMPKVFISELELHKCSPHLQAICHQLIEQISDETLARPDFSCSGRPWNVNYLDYEKLAAESEYASWLAAYGFRANHFTVFFNALKTFKALQDLNDFLKANGYKMNDSGGEIKGTPAELLEQSSTRAEYTQVRFTEGSFPVPACYYEFARRYPSKNGQLYSGFIAASADKIFESTDRH